MSSIKRLLRGLPNLGIAIDERLRKRGWTIDIRHGTGTAAGVSIGNVGGGGNPAYPERFVSSLRRSGDPDALSGDIVLATTGDTSLSQSSAAPHLTFSTPSYTASNGVERINADFCADATVVRTIGDQTLNGEKAFTSFPLTPPTEPSTEYQTANKQYVDSLHAGDRQCYAAVGGSSGEEVCICHVGIKYPTYSSFPADYMMTGTALFHVPSGGGAVGLDNAYATIEWTSTASGGSITSGARAVLAAIACRSGDRANLVARMQINYCSRLSGVYLQLEDTANHNCASSNLLSLLADGVWTEVSLFLIDTSTWNNNLRLTLTIQGTDMAANVGYTRIRFEALYLEQLAH